MFKVLGFIASGSRPTQHLCLDQVLDRDEILSSTETQAESHILFKVLGFVALVSLSFPEACPHTCFPSFLNPRGKGVSQAAETSLLPAPTLPSPVPPGAWPPLKVIVPDAPGLFAPTFLLRLTTHDKPNRMKPNPDFSQEMFWGTT